ncbi:serine/threonine-protein kinase [Hypnocyclicus thermotrophus]|uniref:Serine/threonine-protein kinase n=1 Tax=Hypnocyclicus thermotrophus TaxID=1627895 RepID=A0AA46DXL8_9FUSO|nr:PASTA domain-containing protein [Hypnocyclicus thermotrophus]TDT68532.1 serine/threonine-protein kinase [Hypnocyclicus thermotrophus]
MNKKNIIIFLDFILIIFIIYFSINTGLKFFFNDFLLETPDLSNLTFNEAVVLLENSDIKLKKIDEDFSEFEKGKIYLQIPEAGSAIKKGRTIKVWVSKGKNRIVVPDFSNLDIIDAKVMAEQKGFSIKEIVYTHSNQKINTIITTDPKEGTIMSSDKHLSFLVSSGPINEFVRMPDIIGLNIDDARKKLEKNQLFIGSIEYIENDLIEPNIVFDASISVNEKIKKGSSINIIVSK